MKKSQKDSESAILVREVHGIIMNSLDSYLESISIQDMIDAHNEGVSPKLLMADALEKEAKKLRSQVK